MERCARSYDKTYYDQQDYYYGYSNADANGGWGNLEEGFRGWTPGFRQMGDSSCDSIYNVETCLYDMGDCCLPGKIYNKVKNIQGRYFRRDIFGQKILTDGSICLQK